MIEDSNHPSIESKEQQNKYLRQICGLKRIKTSNQFSDSSQKFNQQKQLEIIADLIQKNYPHKQKYELMMMLEDCNSSVETVQNILNQESEQSQNSNVQNVQQDRQISKNDCYVMERKIVKIIKPRAIQQNGKNKNNEYSMQEESSKQIEAVNQDSCLQAQVLADELLQKLQNAPNLSTINSFSTEAIEHLQQQIIKKFQDKKQKCLEEKQKIKLENKILKSAVLKVHNRLQGLKVQNDIEFLKQKINEITLRNQELENQNLQFQNKHEESQNNLYHLNNTNQILATQINQLMSEQINIQRNYDIF